MTTSIDSLLAEIETFRPVGRVGTMCGVGIALDKIEDPNARAMIGNFIDTSDGISATAVADLLEKHGISIQAGVLRRHRRRITGGDKCKCPVPTEASA